MSTIFLSHSSQDRHAAEQLATRLVQRGYRSIFLDVDVDGGIAAGARWERELYKHLSSCSAVIAICSEASRASRWCFAEIAQARSQGKRIFPVRLDSSEIEPLLTDVQAIDLGDGQGHERLWRGLREAGLDPTDDFGWDPARPPYPGLNRFEERDAAVYFGRSGEIDQLIVLLGRMRRHGPARFALTLGSSGCGKSSLLRAGLVPRLKKDADWWVVVPPFRPMESPIGELARAIASALAEFNRSIDWQNLRERLTCAATPDGRASAIAALADVTRDLTLAAAHREAATVIIVDQLEEALEREGPEVDALLGLVAAGEALGGSVLFLATLRSDYLDALQQHPAITSATFETLPLGPLPPARLPEVIEGPAARAGLRFEPGLVGRLVEDTGSNDALPLLAFTLRELYEACRDDGRMTIEAYEKLGGLTGAVAQRATEVVGDELSPAVQEALRSSFLSMGKIGEEGHVIRRPARAADLPAQAHDLLERLVDNRLLVARGAGDERTLEVSHEALFRVWPTLADWMRNDREFLLWRRRLQSFIEDWKSGSGALIHGAALAQADDWYKRRASALSAVEREFIEASRRADRSKRMRLRLIAASVMVTVAVLSAAALWQGLQAREQAAALRANAFVLVAQQRQSAGDSLASVLLLRETDLARLRGSAIEMAREIQRTAPVPLTVVGATSPVVSAAVSADGRRIAIGSRDGSLRILTPDGRGNPSVTFPGSHSYSSGTSSFFSSEGLPVLHVEFSSDGTRVLTVSDDLAARVWRVDGSGEPQVMRHPHEIISAHFSADGKSVLTVAKDGRVRVWVLGKPDPAVLRPYDPAHEGSQYFFASGLRAAISHDGRFVVTNFTPYLRAPAMVHVWRADGEGPPVVLRGTSEDAESVAFSTAGLLVAAGFEDGTMRVWNADGTGEPRVLAGRDKCSVEDIHFSPDDSRLASYCTHPEDGGMVYVWPLGRDELRRRLKSTGQLVGGGFMHDGRHVAVNSSAGLTIEPLDTLRDPIVLRPRGTGAIPGARDVAISADGSTVLRVTGGLVEVWRRDPKSNALFTWADNMKILGEPTTACLAPMERVTWLSEAPEAGQLGYEACERRYGREPVIPPIYEVQRARELRSGQK